MGGGEAADSDKLLHPFAKQQLPLAALDILSPLWWAHRRRDAYEAGVWVPPAQDAEVAVQQLAALKVPVVEVAHAVVCFGHSLQEVLLLLTWPELSAGLAHNICREVAHSLLVRGLWRQERIVMQITGSLQSR